ncbi:MAG TPA: hypothetical protein VF705_02515 [Longimicrobium sp.]|jgi:hypothetical protein
MRYSRVFRIDQLWILRPATIRACRDIGVVGLRMTAGGLGAAYTVNRRILYRIAAAPV